MRSRTWGSLLSPTCSIMHLGQEILARTSGLCVYCVESIQHGGSFGGNSELRFGFSAVELDRVRPAQRLQPALIPGREQLGPDSSRSSWTVPDVGPARQELHQCVGGPEEGTEHLQLDYGPYNSASALGTSVCMTNIFVLFGVQDQLQQKIVCPGVVTCLNASPDGLFLAAAVGEAVYLWEVSWSFVEKRAASEPPDLMVCSWALGQVAEPPSLSTVSVCSPRTS